MVPGVTAQIGVTIPPLFRSHTEQRHIQDIDLAGMDKGDLSDGEFRRDEVFFDRVRVDVVIDLRQVPPYRPDSEQPQWRPWLLSTFEASSQNCSSRLDF